MTQLSWYPVVKYISNLQERFLRRVSKTRKHRKHAWGTFWLDGEHFGLKFTTFCCIFQFVVNHAHLTVQ